MENPIQPCQGNRAEPSANPGAQHRTRVRFTPTGQVGPLSSVPNASSVPFRYLTGWLLHAPGGDIDEIAEDVAAA